MTYNIACLHFCIYEGSLENNASMLVPLLPEKVLKVNQTQNIAQNVHFAFIPNFSIVSLSLDKTPPVLKTFFKPGAVFKTIFP
jgi:hypothetical protein